MFLPAHTYYFVAAFGRTANSLAALYGGPVYLVGSALYKEDPLDIDVRLPLGDADLLRRFGPQGKLDDNFTWECDWWRYYDQLKQSRRLSRHLPFRIDFQFQRLAIFEQHTGDRLRLDSAPEGFFLAGLTDA